MSRRYNQGRRNLTNKLTLELSIQFTSQSYSQGYNTSQFIGKRAHEEKKANNSEIGSKTKSASNQEIAQSPQLSTTLMSLPTD